MTGVCRSFDLCTLPSPLTPIFPKRRGNTNRLSSTLNPEELIFSISFPLTHRDGMLSSLLT
jgi:hypothetical protein